MRKFKFTIKGHQYEVEVLEIENNHIEVEVNGTHYQVEVNREVKETKTPKLVRAAVPKPKPEESSIKQAPPDKTKPVKTPLPGTILQVLVKPGDEVAAGDVLLIMEAMKMENNIYADKKALVKEVLVKEGDTVLQNDVLVVLE